MRRRLLLGVLAAGYSKAIVAVMQLLMVPALALNWGLPLYGQWLMLTSIQIFLGGSDFGFSTTAGIRLIGEVARGETAEAAVTYRSARQMVVLLTAAMAVVVTGAVLAVPDRVLAVHDAMAADEARLVLALLCGYALLTLHGPLFGAVVRSVGRTAQAIAFEATIQLCEWTAVLVVALTSGAPREAALAYLSIRACGVVAWFWYARHVAPWMRAPAQASPQRIRQMWRPALAAMALPLSQAAYLQGAALAAGAAAGAAAVPIYTSLRTLSRIGLQAVAVVAIPLMPEYTAAHARGDTRRTAAIAGGLAIASLAAGVGYALVIGFFGAPLLALWTGGSIAPPQAMITLTAIGLAIGLLWVPLSDLLLAINRHESFAYWYGLCAVLAIALNFALVRRIGITGAAAANLVLEIAMLGAVARGLLRYGGSITLAPSAFARLNR